MAAFAGCSEPPAAPTLRGEQCALCESPRRDHALLFVNSFDQFEAVQDQEDLPYGQISHLASRRYNSWFFDRTRATARSKSSAGLATRSATAAEANCSTETPRDLARSRRDSSWLSVSSTGSCMPQEYFVRGAGARPSPLTCAALAVRLERLAAAAERVLVEMRGRFGDPTGCTVHMRHGVLSRRVLMGSTWAPVPRPADIAFAMPRAPTVFCRATMLISFRVALALGECGSDASPCTAGGVPRRNAPRPELLVQPRSLAIHVDRLSALHNGVGFSRVVRPTKEGGPRRFANPCWAAT